MFAPHAPYTSNAANAVNAHDLFPPPKGLSLAPASTVHGSEAAMETLSGASSVLSSAVWDAHGCPTMARMHALRHVRCDSTRINHSSRKNSPGYKLDDSYNTPASLEDADLADGAAAAAGDTATAWRSSRGTRRRTTAQTPRRMSLPPRLLGFEMETF